jgi:hypothetical protein
MGTALSKKRSSQKALPGQVTERRETTLWKGWRYNQQRKRREVILSKEKTKPNAE